VGVQALVVNLKLGTLEVDQKVCGGQAFQNWQVSHLAMLQVQLFLKFYQKSEKG